MNLLTLLLGAGYISISMIHMLSIDMDLSILVLLATLMSFSSLYLYDIYMKKYARVEGDGGDGGREGEDIGSIEEGVTAFRADPSLSSISNSLLHLWKEGVKEDTAWR